MRDDDHRRLVLGQLAQDAQHLAGQLGVKGRGRLIKAEDVRVQRQCAGNRHALLLPAGKLVRVVVLPVRKPHLRQQGLCLRFNVGQNLPPVLLVVGALLRQELARQHDVLQRRVLGKQVEALEHKAEVQPLFADGFFALRFGVGGAPQRFTRYRNAAGVGGLQKVQTAQQRCFAGAGRADDGESLALGQIKRDVAQHLCGTKALADAVYFQQCHSRAPLT